MDINKIINKLYSIKGNLNEQHKVHKFNETNIFTIKNNNNTNEYIRKLPSKNLIFQNTIFTIPYLPNNFNNIQEIIVDNIEIKTENFEISRIEGLKKLIIKNIHNIKTFSIHHLPNVEELEIEHFECSRLNLIELPVKNVKYSSSFRTLENLFISSIGHIDNNISLQFDLSKQINITILNSNIKNLELNLKNILCYIQNENHIRIDIDNFKIITNNIIIENNNFSSLKTHVNMLYFLYFKNLLKTNMIDDLLFYITSNDNELIKDIHNFNIISCPNINRITIKKDEIIKPFLLPKGKAQENQQRIQDISFHNSTKSLKRYTIPKYKNNDIRQYQEVHSLHIINNTNLKELNLIHLDQLKKLYCYNNQLTELNISRCNQLIELDVSENQLTELDVYGCNQLRILDVSKNQLTELNISGCNQLRNIDYSINPNELVIIN